ncbi:MAG: MlaD family protein, partial [Flavobacterium sp.]
SPLQTKVEATVVTADSLLHNLNNVVDKQTQENLRASIAEMRITMSEFSKAAKTLNATISGNKTNIDATMANLNKTSANFAEISDSIDPEQIASAINSLENSMKEVDKMMAEVQSGKGTLGKLLKDEAMYNNLADASNELKELLADLKRNPKRYVHFSVFGKKGTPYEETPKKK